MKQTKPFGRAYTPAAEAPGAPGQGPDTPLPPQSDTPAADDGAQAGSSADLFSLGAGTLTQDVEQSLAPWRQKLQGFAVMSGTAVTLLVVFVLMRDSMALANLLQQVTTEETVMVCKEGKMIYPDYSILDRLMNNGRFLCTEWKVQRGFLTLPRQ